ncbi:MAG: D-ribulose kinase [bacterium]|nr:FGGY-family carbohydrate kinase [bacterium]MBV6480653.1 D-ribulose kinase [bacterium]
MIGLDVGTGGARALAVDPGGKILAGSSSPLPAPEMNDDGASEQSADSWRQASIEALEGCLSQLGDNRQNLKAISIDATSGTVVFLDGHYRPLSTGILHNDTRSAEEAIQLNSLLAGHCREAGYRFGATFALSKILYFQHHFPHIFNQVQLIAHQADYVAGVLSGEWGISDPSNSLKTGYNLVADAWPAELESLNISHLLPRIVPSGTAVGTLRKQFADEWGVPAATRIRAGVTDSTAGFLATGAALNGEFAVCLGTTLAFKGISKDLIRDPRGVVYCHRHPGGGWLPGGASNVGGACLKKNFGGRNLGELDRHAFSRFPTATLSYPLVEVGERFPFDSPGAVGFMESPTDEIDRYLALLQGVGLVERWCFVRFEELGITVRPPIYTTGNGSRSDEWNQIRANILQCCLARSRSTDPAFGVAVLAAAMEFHGGDLAAASRAMTATDRIFEPVISWSDWAQAQLGRLRAECRERGLIQGNGS